jgi:hypothetical protein
MTREASKSSTRKRRNKSERSTMDTKMYFSAFGSIHELHRFAAAFAGGKSIPLKVHSEFNCVFFFSFSLFSLFSLLKSFIQQVISGGLDCVFVNWHLSRAKPLFKQELGDSFVFFLLFTLTRNRSSQHNKKGVMQNQAQVINPPFIHCVDSSEDGKTVLMGLGNGNLFLRSLASKGAPSFSWEAHNAAVSHT